MAREVRYLEGKGYTFAPRPGQLYRLNLGKVWIAVRTRK